MDAQAPEPNQKLQDKTGKRVINIIIGTMTGLASAIFVLIVGSLIALRSIAGIGAESAVYVIPFLLAVCVVPVALISGFIAAVWIYRLRQAS